MAQNSYAIREGFANGKSKRKHVTGTLAADRFTIDRSERYWAFSGGGNVEYGKGKYDSLDLTEYSINAVVNWSSAECRGEIFNPGNGDRVFDALTLSDGCHILFEGLDVVEFADAVLMLANDPDDPRFEAQWNLHILGVHNAWRFTRGSSRILIGIQDTGLGYCNSSRRFHTELLLSKTVCISDNVRDDYERRVHGGFRSEPDSHGTSVQAIIGSASNNGRGMSGINWKSETFHIDILDGNKGDLSLYAATQRMLQKAKTSEQRLIVNLSAEGFSPCAKFDKLIEQHQENVLFVFAAGNGGKGLLAHPAVLSSRYDNVIAVGASYGWSTDENQISALGDRYDYSNFGVGLDLMGPAGVPTIKSTGCHSKSSVFGWRSAFHGTSAATPHVSGIASLVWGINTQLSAVDVKKVLIETAFDVWKKGRDFQTGHGLVDADMAVRRSMAIARANSKFVPYEIEESTGMTAQRRQQWPTKQKMTSNDLSLFVNQFSLASSLCA